MAQAEPKTELFISVHRANKCQVVARPIVTRPLERNEITVLYTSTARNAKALCIAWAEGRQSATGQRISI